MYPFISKNKYNIANKIKHGRKESPTLVAQYLLSETYEIRTPLPNGTIPWSPKEKQRLMNAYNHNNKTNLQTLFPDRTLMALSTKASRLKIPRPNKRFTEQEDQLLLMLKQTGYTYPEMVPYFQHRSATALKTRLYRLNIFLNNPTTPCAFRTCVY